MIAYSGTCYRISIITPIFNGEDHIGHCIQNVISQFVVGLEHIIVDGGSTDKTLSIVEAYAALHPHIRLIRGPDDGQSDAINKGIRAARADIIGILNCDDHYTPNAVNDALTILSQRTEPAFVIGNVRVINGSHECLYLNRPHDLRLESLVLGWWYTSPPMNPCGYFYHKAIHEIVGWYDVADHYTMDQTFLFDCTKAAIEMVYVDRTWGNFRYIEGAKSFDDERAGTSVARVRKLYRRYISDFTIQQRIKMYLIFAIKVPRRLAWLMRAYFYNLRSSHP